MNLALAINIIRFCIGLRGLADFIEQKVRAKQNAADLLVINGSCGEYAGATDVGVKADEAEEIRNAFRSKDTKRITRGDDSN